MVLDVVFRLSYLLCAYTYMPWIEALENEDSDNRLYMYIYMNDVD